MKIIYIVSKRSFKKQHLFELTSLLKMDLTFLIKFAQKLTSLIKMDLTSLFKRSFKKQPSALWLHCPRDLRRAHGRPLLAPAQHLQRRLRQEPLPLLAR